MFNFRAALYIKNLRCPFRIVCCGVFLCALHFASVSGVFSQISGQHCADPRFFACQLGLPYVFDLHTGVGRVMAGGGAGG